MMENVQTSTRVVTLEKSVQLLTEVILKFRVTGELIFFSLVCIEHRV